jgi:hypothetical protein
MNLQSLKSLIFSELQLLFNFEFGMDMREKCDHVTIIMNSAVRARSTVRSDEVSSTKSEIGGPGAISSIQCRSVSCSLHISQASSSQITRDCLHLE